METQSHEIETKRVVQTRPGLTWRECDINAEDCHIKAAQNPSLRNLYLAQAVYWRQLAIERW